MPEPPLIIPVKPFPEGKVFAEPAKSPLEVLVRARAVLAPRGAWVKGKYTLGARRCAKQAIMDSDGVHVDAASRFVLQAAEARTGRHYGAIPDFNDDSKTTKILVLQVLDDAIELAQAAEKGA